MPIGFPYGGGGGGGGTNYLDGVLNNWSFLNPLPYPIGAPTAHSQNPLNLDEMICCVGAGINNLFRFNVNGGYVNIYPTNPGVQTIQSCGHFGTFLIAADRERIWRSIDNGASWTQVYFAGGGNNKWALERSPSGALMLMQTNSSGYFRSDDDGVTWAFRSGFGWNANGAAGNPVFLDTTWYKSVNTVEIGRSVDNGLNWTRHATGITNAQALAYMPNIGALVARVCHTDASADSFAVSMDGTSWTVQTFSAAGAGIAQFGRQMFYDDVSGSLIFFNTNNEVIVTEDLVTFRRARVLATQVAISASGNECKLPIIKLPSGQIVYYGAASGRGLTNLT